MKAIRIIFFCSLMLLLAAAMAGCAKSKDEDGSWKIFYLNKEITKIVPRPYEPAADAKNTKAIVEELLAQLRADSGDLEYQKPIPDDAFIRYSLEETLLTLYFDSGYARMDRVEEVLARAAIVRTMMQAEGVDYLTFYVAGKPLSDAKGNPIGAMTDESFVENPGEQINAIETAELTLYFANRKGDKLLPETKKVRYSSNISMEKLVMEHLLEGPSGKKKQAAIPEGTKLLGIYVSEGVCYVNLDENFLKQNYNIEEAVVINSIVNSLTVLSNISKVQISVEGSTSGVYRETFELSGFYERNLDYVAQ